MLPPLRSELQLLPGGDHWTLFDPVRNRSFRLGRLVVEILSRWNAGEADEVAARTRSETGLTVDEDDVNQALIFLAEQELLVPGRPDQITALARRAASRRSSLINRFLHAYLFVRLPLVRPDRFLDATLPYVRPLGSRAFLWMTLTALALGLVLAGRQWDSFHAAIQANASLEGVLLSGLALALVKVAHELGHAYVAKAKGCRVPTMGVALMVLWPVLYTDTNESWRLGSRRDRLAVAGAGILTELAAAAWATLLWALLPDGGLRDAVFLVAAITWVSSLLVNLSPFMRFDGYFLLMDVLDFPNLHARSFALARWALRETLFDLGLPPPEDVPPARRRGLVLFAFAVWIYRLVLFLGIAALVYGFFIKVVGLFLFAVEIGWFVLRPLRDEMRQWWRLRAAIGKRARWRLGLLAGLALLLPFAPWDGSVSAPALLKASRHAVLYTATGGQVTLLNASEGLSVAQDQELLLLDNADLRHQLEQAERRVRLLDQELALQSLDVGDHARGQAVREQAEAALAEAAGLRREIEAASLKSPFAGSVVDMMPDLAPGQWLAANQRVLAIRADGPPVIDAYVAERDAARVRVGGVARFVPASPESAAIPCRVVEMDSDTVRRLADPALAVPAGGEIPVRAAAKAGPVPEAALYRLRCVADQPQPVTAERRGRLVIDAEHQSPAAAILRWVAAVLVRESGM